jgi:hypothetical protein
MAYTVSFVLFDLPQVYSAALPTLAGVLDVPALGAPSTATSTTTPFSITFAAPPNPPGAPGTLLLTDAAGPGDYFRSGPVPTWPAEPVSVTAATGILPLTFASLEDAIHKLLPISIGIPLQIGVAIGAATGFWFSPFNINLTSVVLGPSHPAGRVRASFQGVISFFTYFIPRRTDVKGAVDLTLAPSGDATSPTTIVNVGASNLSLSPGFISPLSTPLLALLAPLFSGALSGPLTTRVNTALAPMVATALAMVPLTPAGTPLFSAAATVSARRITVLTNHVILQAVLSELIALPVDAPGPGGPGGPAAPGAEDRLVVTIDPQPEFDVARTYVVRVRRESDLAAVEGATVTIGTYMPVTGASSSTSGQTDMQGVVALDTTLRARFQPSSNPTHTGQLEIRWPKLTVTKVGFQTFTQELSD